jgi:hypothetical protein
METPCYQDRAAKISSLEWDNDERQVDIQGLEEREAEGENILEDKKEQNEAIDKAEKEISELLESEKCLGFVYGSGGQDRIDVSSRMPMDWGVVRPLRDDVVWNNVTQLNKVRFAFFDHG